MILGGMSDSSCETEMEMEMEMKMMMDMVSLAGVPDWVFTKTRHAPNRAEAVP